MGVLLMAGATVAIVGALTLTLGLAAVSKGFRFSTWGGYTAVTGTHEGTSHHASKG